MSCKFKLGQQVKINKEKMESVLKEIKEKGYNTVYEDLKKLIDTNDGIHKITNIYTKNTYTKNETYRYELDNDFVFYENELIKVE